jgi:hypothetical protein
LTAVTAVTAVAAAVAEDTNLLLPSVDGGVTSTTASSSGVDGRKVTLTDSDISETGSSAASMPSLPAFEFAALPAWAAAGVIIAPSGNGTSGVGSGVWAQRLSGAGGEYALYAGAGGAAREVSAGEPHGARHHLGSCFSADAGSRHVSSDNGGLLLGSTCQLSAEALPISDGGRCGDEYKDDDDDDFVNMRSRTGGLGCELLDFDDDDDDDDAVLYYTASAPGGDVVSSEIPGSAFGVVTVTPSALDPALATAAAVAEDASAVDVAVPVPAAAARSAGDADADNEEASTPLRATDAHPRIIPFRAGSAEGTGLGLGPALGLAVGSRNP